MTEPRWKIKRANGTPYEVSLVVGPETDWIEVVPADELADAEREITRLHDRIDDLEYDLERLP